MLNIRILLISSEMWARLLTKRLQTTATGNYTPQGQPSQLKPQLHDTTTSKECDYVSQNSVKLTRLSDSDTQSELKVF